MRREDDDAEDKREAREEGLERVGGGGLNDVEKELEALADAAAGVAPTGKKAELLEARERLGADGVLVRLEEPVWNFILGRYLVSGRLIGRLVGRFRGCFLLRLADQGRS